jgi:hypothetical protein
MDNNNPVLGEIEKRLLEGSSAISSETGALEKTISDSISSVKQGQAATESRITSDFKSERNYLTNQGEASATTALEGRQGFGTQLAAMRMLTETTDKTLRDLDVRKQDALLANDSAAAQRISDLQLKEYEYRQKAKQDMFNNLISVGNYSLNKSTFEAGREEEAKRFGLAKRAQKFTETQGERTMSLAERAQDFGESEAMANIALEYGVTLQEGDTLDTVAAKAAPFASEKQKLSLEQIRAEISAAKATTARAMQQIKMDDQEFSDAERLSIAAGVRKGTIDITKMPVLEQAKIHEVGKQLSEEAFGKLLGVAKASKFDSMEELQAEATRQGLDFTQSELADAFFSEGADVPARPGILQRGRQNDINRALKEAEKAGKTVMS